MQQIRGGGYFINVRNTHVCYMKLDFEGILQSVRYWYEMCDELVLILNSVKFMKCEIRGSTMRTYPVGREVYISWSFDLRPYFKCASGECSDETALSHMQ